MGEVIIRFRVLPATPEDFDGVKKALEGLEPEKMEEEPIAFGLKALSFVKIVPEAPGADESLEEKIKAIPGVQTVEVISVTRGL